LSFARFSSFVAFFGIEAAGAGAGFATGAGAGVKTGVSTTGSSNEVPPLILR